MFTISLFDPWNLFVENKPGPGQVSLLEGNNS